jgi:hypothetical protein
MKPENSGKKKMLKLKVDEQIRYQLLGISSHDNDYRVVWAMNRTLNMAFVRSDNLLLQSKSQDGIFEFSRFKWTDETKYLSFTLISNRCEDGFLLPELKNLDFLLQVSGDSQAHEMAALVKQLKTVEGISAVYLLQPEKIKGIGILLE